MDQIEQVSRVGKLFRPNATSSMGRVIFACWFKSITYKPESKMTHTAYWKIRTVGLMTRDNQQSTTTINTQHSMINNQQTTFNSQQSTLKDRWWTINNINKNNKTSINSTNNNYNKINSAMKRLKHHRENRSLHILWLNSQRAIMCVLDLVCTTLHSMVLCSME